MTDWASKISVRAGQGNGAVPAAALALEDAVLLRRCRRGDLSAFGPLVEKYQDRVFNAVFRLCGNRDDAEELCQDAFVKALENLAAFRQDSGFYTWLFRIAVNLTISRRRRGGRVKFQPLDASGEDNPSGRMQDALPDRRQPDPQDLAAGRDVSRRVLKALDELDDEFRVVVVLRDVEEMNYDQISQVLSVPVGTVKSRIYRARCLLQEKLHDLIA